MKLNRNGSLASIVDDDGSLKPLYVASLDIVEVHESLEECFDVLTGGEHTTVKEVCHHLGFPEPEE